MDKIGDIDDKTWRKIELLRLSLDIVDKTEEYESNYEDVKRLEYLENFSQLILNRLGNNL